MCGRYALFGPESRLQEYFGVDGWPAFGPRYNIAPSASVPVIRQAPDGRRVVDLLKWGLVPHWSKDALIGAKLSNARGETVAEKPSFRSAYRRRRCIVPAAGFFEWQAVAGARKLPWFASLSSGEPMALGGLWESWTAADGSLLRSFCVITVAANAVMSPIHDRMPVILQAQDWASWLAPESPPDLVAALVTPAPAASMTAWPVSRRVSRATEDDAALLAPMESDEDPSTGD